ncbi:hypothetical protein FCV25MIE_24891, partial [Fagus crenata]
MANSLEIGLKTLFTVLGCRMLATLIFTLSIEHRCSSFSWMVATLVDFYINVVPLAAWVLYKEPNWISAILWIIMLLCFASITTCAYILMQFQKLSSQEHLQDPGYLHDPMYCVLLRHPNKGSTPVVTMRIIFSALGCLMLGTLVYTLLIDGSPFHKELLTPWMIATLIDFYINVVALSICP